MSSASPAQRAPTSDHARALPTAILTLGRVGVLAVVIMLFVAVAAPWLAPYAPDVQVAAPFSSPSFAHWLGTDDLGQDVFSQLLLGARTSLAVGVFAALVATSIGTAVGLAAGVARGVLDTVLMRLVDVMLTLPFVPLVIVLSAFAGPGFGSTVGVIGALMWARTARVLRSQVLSARERGPATAARAMGARAPHILWHHVFPSVFPLVVPELVRAVNAAIVLESSLAFLGLGDPTRLSWGSMLYHANARSAFLTDAWLWWELPPGLCIGGTVLAFVLIGYAIEERLRPRLAIGWRPPAREALRARRSQQAEGGTDAGVSSAHVISGDQQVIASAFSDTAVVRVESLHVRFPTANGIVHAVNDVSFSIDRGEVIGLVGESGSGKSTVLTAVMRLLPTNADVHAGRIAFRGRDIAGLSDDDMRRLRRTEVALVPQSAMNALNPVRTIGAQLQETIHLPESGQRRARAQALLEMVSIPVSRLRAYPHELSGGMRQRVVIAMAMANTPSLIIADEPTSGLDVVLQTELLNVLRSLRDEFGMAIILVSHDLAAVAQLADHVLVMRNGQLVDRGVTRTMLAHPTHPYTRRLVSAIPTLRSPTTGLADVDAALDWRTGQRTSNASTAMDRRDVARGPVASTPPLLEFRNASKAFGRGVGAVTAMDQVQLSVQHGERVGLIGASGAGKSTVARAALGLTQLDAGQLLLDGIDFTSPSRHMRRARARSLHMIFQDPYDSLAPGLRVEDIVAEPCVIHGSAGNGSVAAAVATALVAVGLSPASRYLRAFPHELSGGERQRVAMARAMMLNPKLIVADEPTSQLDAPLRADMVVLMRQLQAAHGTSYLYITHDIAMAAMFCDRLFIMHSGRIIESGPTADILAAPREEYTRKLLDYVTTPFEFTT